MKLGFCFFVTGLFSLASVQSSLAHGVTNAKAAELSLHRLEKLVILCNLSDPTKPINIPSQPGFDPKKCKNDPSKKKNGVDPSYQNKLSALRVELLEHEAEEEPSFRTTMFQPKSHDGSSQRALEIVLDEEGRPLSYKEVPGGEPHSVPAWPEKDPTFLTEIALHYLTGSSTKPEHKPFGENLTDVSLSLGKNPEGKVVANIDCKAEGEEKTLRVRVKPNGDLDSTQLMN